MNISASNGYYYPLVTAYTAKAGVGAHPQNDREALSAETVELTAAQKKATAYSDADRQAALASLRAEAYRGRLADNAGQNSHARRALAEYTGVVDQPRREELRALGVDVYT